MATEKITLNITSLGGLGDGIAEHEGAKYYVPYSAAGDVITTSTTQKKADGFSAKIEHILTPSPARTTPPCNYFTQCGGCALQHLSSDAYQNFKLTRAVDALRDAGYDASLLTELNIIPTASRRRAEFKISGSDLGFFKSETNEVVAIDRCLILDPALQALLSPLKNFVADHPSALKTIALTLADNGIDMLAQEREPVHDALIAFAKQHSLLRLSTPQKTLYQNELPIIHCGTVTVDLPAGGFLQASAMSQQIMAEWVVRHLPKKKRVIDLFSGIGTFTFPASEISKEVVAFESSSEMINALNHAAKNHALGHVKGIVQDLVKDPVDIETLSKSDAVIINPPRPGAAAQVKTIAASSVKHVVMVSCNPATFSRDAAQLKRGGFSLKAAIALDQFIYSPHLEILAKFER